MSDLISNLAKQNIYIALMSGTDLEVTAPDESWDNGLEGYLKSYKQELINELSQNRDLSTGQEEVKNTEHRNPATTATTATNGTNSADPFATSLLQVATRHPVDNTSNMVDKNGDKQNEIDFSVVELFYPDRLDIDTCQMILSEVRQLSDAEQTNWWLALSVWLNTGTGDLDWRCTTFEKLSDCWDSQRPDIVLAKAMFAGVGSRIITQAIDK